MVCNATSGRFCMRWLCCCPFTRLGALGRLHHLGHLHLRGGLHVRLVPHRLLGRAREERQEGSFRLGRQLEGNTHGAVESVHSIHRTIHHPVTSQRTWEQYLQSSVHPPVLMERSVHCCTSRGSQNIRCTWSVEVASGDVMGWDDGGETQVYGTTAGCSFC